MHSPGFRAQYLGNIGSALIPNSIKRLRNSDMRLKTSCGTTSISCSSSGSDHNLKLRNFKIRFKYKYKQSNINSTNDYYICASFI